MDKIVLVTLKATKWDNKARQFLDIWSPDVLLLLYFFNYGKVALDLEAIFGFCYCSRFFWETFDLNFSQKLLVSRYLQTSLESDLTFIFLNPWLGTCTFKNIFKSNGFLIIYGVTSTDKSNFQPYYSIPYAIRFQKMCILWVVQFITEKPVPELCFPYFIWGNFTAKKSIFSGSSKFTQ